MSGSKKREAMKRGRKSGELEEVFKEENPSEM
uniref:Uncharacterized protein n=1 Tax=Nelumbo nucifera TaxID=4432 RepID=A0A822XF13_NELNU|nr:TPA_asm: hypothetical protein HUJ06_020393 [Nelumbo nucifera]